MTGLHVCTAISEVSQHFYIKIYIRLNKLLR
uniref:Uncharacterized protein n=1 Tax=Anguilla anguilla TaxID=7936 RepID=A0A0E9RK93_ANGAN